MRERREEDKLQADRYTFKQLSQRAKFSSPIEFRPLLSPDRNQPQGLIEMFVDIPSKDESKQFPPQKLTPLKQKQDYEVRLIIWETSEVPLVDGSSVDIYIKAKYYADSFDDVSIEKQTDIHHGNTTGKGKFNYRMKFRINMPTTFPRIMLQLYDYNSIAAD